MKTTLLLDGDITIYTFASRVEVATDWGDGVHTLHADLKSTVSEVKVYLEELQEKFDAELIVCLSCPTHKYFRHDLLDGNYKAGRTARKPMILAPLRAFPEDSYTCFVRLDLEADDVMGILSTSKKIVKGKKIIVSVDKDMRTIPGFLWRGKSSKGVPTVYEITEEEADYWHLHQALTGDAADGYSGCPGVGKVGASKILDEESEVEPWDRVVGAFDKKGFGSEEALTQARVARILRASDYDFKKKQPILWTP